MLSSKEIAKRKQLKHNKPRVYEKVMDYERRYALGESMAVMQIQYDYKCNFTCQHCSIRDYRHKSDRRKMTPIDIKMLCDQADEYGLAQIDFSGGEPLMFGDLGAVIKAIEPYRFYLMVDTNGWLLTKDKAFELKHLGVDKIQVGLDSLNKEEHDTFRNKEGAFYHAIDAIENVNKAGLVLQVSTVVPKERIRSVEFEKFLKFTDGVGACVNAILPKPVGAWENYDPNITEEDLKYMDELSEKYNVSVHHRSIHFGIKLGCIAVKKIISINSYGDVMPCIWMYASLGNIFETPLRQILEKGMKHFGGYRKTCNMSEDTKFIEKYRNVTKGKDLPIEIEDLIC